MKTKFDIMTSSKHFIPAIFISSILCLLVPSGVMGEEKAQPKQKEFDTQEQAVESLIQAASTFDVPVLKEILGEQGEKLVDSEDPVLDKKRALTFVEEAKEKKSIDIDPKNPNRAILSVGEEAYPLPIPIIKHKGKWTFNTKEGIHEMLLRRVGANELDAIEVCRGFVEAQRSYSQEKHDGALVNQYAQRFISTPGKHDGLAWQNADGTWGGPVGEGIAKALAQGYTDKTQPYHGYFFKVLKGQGPAAPLGQIDFVVEGAMIGGFALVAVPAQYRVTGVKTFLVSHTGIVYEKDLGPESLELFKKMDRFNPDKSWHQTSDQW